MKPEYVFKPASDHILSIDSPTHEIQYLITGSDKALLVDTGSGYLNLKEKVAEHTDLPVEVVLTHGHPDHSFGIGGYDTVYMNEKDEPIYRQAVAAGIQKGFVEGSLGMPVEEADINYAPEDIVFQSLKEGDVFDLGGVHVHVYEVPGHTPGSVVLLVEEDGVLITGDTANTNTWLFLPESSSVESYRKEMENLLEKTRGKYHRVFTTHRDVDTSPRLLEEGIAVCDAVLNGTNTPVPVQYMGMDALIAKEANPDLTLSDGTCFNLAYSPSKIHNA